ncbi:MAG TPA: hypothetical protein VF790_00615 [Dissulfurispiraceae bacterium]
MSGKTIVFYMIVISTILAGTCMVENLFYREAEPVTLAVISPRAYMRERVPAISAGPVTEQFVVETTFRRCEGRCDEIFGRYVTDTFSTACRDMCYEMWLKNRKRRS